MASIGMMINCPGCGRKLVVEVVNKNREKVHPVVPGHLPDRDGMMRIELQKKPSSTPRPW